MTVVSGEPAGDNEVDRAEWVPFEEAAGRITYRRDVTVLEALLDVVDSDALGQ